MYCFQQREKKKIQRLPSKKKKSPKLLRKYGGFCGVVFVWKAENLRETTQKVQYFIPLLFFLVFIVHSLGHLLWKQFQFHFHVSLLRAPKGNDKMMLFHRNARCFFLRRNLQRKFINRSDEVKVFLGRSWPVFQFPPSPVSFSLSPNPSRNGDRAFASIRKAIRAIPSSKGTKRPISIGNVNKLLSLLTLADPADSPHRRGMSRYISFRNRTCSS